MAKEIFFVSDDFGMSAEVNAAIVHAHREGVLWGAALMMGQPGTEEAVALARANPSLRVGIHFHFNDSKPVTREHWPWGPRPAAAGWAIGLLPAARRLATEEIRAQWDLFCATGLPCAFINSHHHLHCHPLLAGPLLEVLGAPQNNAWIRAGLPCFFSKKRLARFTASCAHRLLGARWRNSFWSRTDTLWGLDRIFGMNAAEVAEAVRNLPEGRHEFLFHPRTISNDADTQCLIDLKNRGIGIS